MGRDRVLLLDHYRRIYAVQSGRPPFALTPEALQLWEAYRFPGNVRELRNIVIRLTAKFAGASVGVRELETELDPQEEGGVDRADAAIPVLPQNSADLSGVALAHLRQAHRFELDGTLRLWEQAYIDAAMLLTQGNVSQAAKLLGINRTTLYNRIGSLARGAPAEADLRASGSRSVD
jgi:two-component system nitrogen regulation response regulator GlnG